MTKQTPRPELPPCVRPCAGFQSTTVKTVYLVVVGLLFAALAGVGEEPGKATAAGAAAEPSIRREPVEWCNISVADAMGTRVAAEGQQVVKSILDVLGK